MDSAPARLSLRFPTSTRPGFTTPRSADGVVHPQPALDVDHVERPLEWRGSRRAHLAGPADGLEKVLESRRGDDPEHHEIVGALVDDLVLDVVAEEACGAGHEPMLRAVDHDPPAAAEADLQLYLLAVRVLANAPAGRHALEAHGETIEAGARWIQRGIGMAIGGNGLPVGWALSRLHDNGASSDRFAHAHGWLLTALPRDLLTPPPIFSRPRLQRSATRAQRSWSSQRPSISR